MESNGFWVQCDLCNDYICHGCDKVEELNANDYYSSVCLNQILFGICIQNPASKIEISMTLVNDNLQSDLLTGQLSFKKDIFKFEHNTSRVTPFLANSCQETKTFVLN